MNREAIVRLLEQSGLEAYRESLASLIFPTCQLRLQREEDRCHVGRCRTDLLLDQRRGFGGAAV